MAPRAGRLGVFRRLLDSGLLAEVPNQIRFPQRNANPPRVGKGQIPRENIWNNSSGLYRTIVRCVVTSRGQFEGCTVMHGQYRLDRTFPECLSTKNYRPVVILMRAGHNLGRFCDNILARSGARLGTYEVKGSDLFLFRLNMDDDRALRAAIAIVNEAGNYFLRDGFQAEDLVPQMVDAVDAAEATGPDGGIDVEKALDARSRRRAPPKTSAWPRPPMYWHHPKPRRKQVSKLNPGRYSSRNQNQPAWRSRNGSPSMAPPGMRVKRAPERRARMQKPIAGPDRRLILHGRRQSDDPKIQAW